MFVCRDSLTLNVRHNIPQCSVKAIISNKEDLLHKYCACNPTACCMLQLSVLTHIEGIIYIVGRVSQGIANSIGVSVDGHGYLLIAQEPKKYPNTVYTYQVY